MNREQFVRGALGQLAIAAEPLRRVAQDPPSLYQLLAGLGWSLPSLIAAESQPLVDAVAKVETSLRSALPAASLTSGEEIAGRIEQALREAMTNLEAAARQMCSDASAQIAAQLAIDLADYLLLEYLGKAWPNVTRACFLLGLIGEETAAQLELGEGAGKRVVRAPVQRLTTQLGALSRLAVSPLSQLLSGALSGHGAFELALEQLSRKLELLELSLRAGLEGDLALELAPPRLLTRGQDATATVTLTGSNLPLVDAGELRLPFTAGPLRLELTVDVHHLALSVTVDPAALPELPAPAPLAGFSVELTAGCGAVAPELTLSRRTGELLRLDVKGGLRIGLPLDRLALGTGARLVLEGSGCLALQLGKDPSLHDLRLASRASDVRVGGPGGLLLKGATVEVDKLALPLPRDAAWTATASGRLELPGVGASEGSSVEVKATLAAGAFTLGSTVDVTLPGGLVLHAAPGKPVFTCELRAGLADDAALTLRVVDALVDVPHERGVQQLKVAGTLAAKVRAGALQLERVALQIAEDRDWPLRGGLILSELQGGVTWPSAAEAPGSTPPPAPRELQLTLSGKARLGPDAPLSGTGRAELSGTVTARSASDVRLDGTLCLQGVGVRDRFSVLDASLSVAVRTSPPSVELTLLDGRAGLFARPGDPAKLETWQLGFEELTGKAVFDAAGFSIALDGKLDLPPEHFAAAPGAKPQLTLRDTKVIGRAQPRSFALQSAELELADLRLGGLKVDAGKLTLRDFAEPPGPQPWSVEAAADLRLPGGTPVHLEGRFGPAGFSLGSRAVLDLPGGVKIHPLLDDAKKPKLVLSLEESLGAGRVSARFAVDGEVEIPHAAAPGGVGRLRVGGHLEVHHDASGATVIDSFEAHGDSEGAWVLPGGLHLRGFGARVLFENRDFALEAHGAVAFFPGAEVKDPRGADAELRARVVARDGGLTIAGGIAQVHIDLLRQARLFDATLRFEVTTRPLEGKFWVENVKAGLVRSGEQDDLDSFLFAVDKVWADFDLRQGFVLNITKGELELPAQYFNGAATDGARPKVLIDGQKLTLAYDEPSSRLSLTGRLTAQNFSLRAPGDGAHATLQTGTLVFAASMATSDRSLAGNVAAQVHFEKMGGAFHLKLPDGQDVDIEFSDVAWDLEGFPVGQIGIGKDLAIHFGGAPPDDCFKILILGKDEQGNVRNHLDVTREGRFHKFAFYGAVRVQVPLKLIQHDAAHVPAGAPSPEVHAEAQGTVELTNDPDGSPQITVEELACGGTFRLGAGANAVLVNDATLRAKNVDQLFAKQADPARPFTLALDGSLVFHDDGPTLGLDNARFEFKDLSHLGSLPQFRLQGFKVGTGAAFKGLPIEVRDVHFDFVNENLPVLPMEGGLLAPENLKLTLTAGIKIPMGSSAKGMAEVKDVKVSWEKGLPKATVAGLAFGIDDLKIAGMGVSGAVYLGGLDRQPPAAIVAGKVGGEMSGMGVDCLIAWAPDKPLGFCLDASFGTAGIPLGPDGFILNGASGGVSFLNTAGDPTDFSRYVEFDSAGKPSPKGDPPDAPQPDYKAKRGAKRSLPTVRPSPTTLPECPGDCPPPSMNVLCQPHPDQALFPGRAIVKFSSLDPAFLEERGLKSRLEALQDATPANIAHEASVAIRAQVESLAPLGALPALLQKEARDKLDRLERLLLQQIEQALGKAGGATPWDVVSYLAYRGLDCVDETLQYTGSLSYVGVGAFASIEGGVNYGSTGAAGVIGDVKVLGMKIGRLRGFLDATSEKGQVDPSICGDLRFELGPLELGNVSFLYKLVGSLDDLGAAIVEAVRPLGDPVLKKLLEQVLHEANGARKVVTNPRAELAKLNQTQAVALIGRMLAAPAGEITVDRVQEVLRGLLHACWDSFNPKFSLCGMVSPKLFGIPLAGELIAVRGWGDKTELGTQFSFSPLSLLVGAFSMAIANLLSLAGEHASFSAVVPLPDPILLLEDGMSGFLPQPAELQKAAEKGLRYLLNNASFLATYSLTPLGMKMVDAIMRAVLPDLTHHPALHPGWKMPEKRGKNFPSRGEVLSAALEQGHLGNPRWRGNTADLAALKFSGGRSAAGLSLSQDYFPHGGIIGAGRISPPRMLVDEAPAAEFETLANPDAKLPDRAHAAIEIVTRYILQTVDVGSIVFYIPAPNPLGKIADDPQQLLHAICAHELPPGQPFSKTIESFNLAFINGHLKGRFFGVDLGEAELELVAPTHNPEREGHFLVRAKAQSASKLRQLIEGDATLEIRLHGKPPQPIEARFKKLLDKLKAAKHHDNQLQAAVGETLQAIQADLPKAGLEASVKLRVPDSLRALVRADAHLSLYAFTPGYGPRVANGTALEAARFFGGAAFLGELEFHLGGFRAKAGVRLAVAPDHGHLRVHGEWVAGVSVSAPQPSGAPAAPAPASRQGAGSTSRGAGREVALPAGFGRGGFAAPAAPRDEDEDHGRDDDRRDNRSDDRGDHRPEAPQAVPVDQGGVSVRGLHGKVDSRPPAGEPLATMSGEFDLPAIQLGPFTFAGVEVGPALTLDAPAKVRFDFALRESGFVAHVFAEASFRDLHLGAGPLELRVAPGSPQEFFETVRQSLRGPFEGPIASQLAADAQRALDEAAARARADAEAAAKRLKDEADAAAQRARDEAQALEDKAEEEARKKAEQLKHGPPPPPRFGG